jgi:hypothetical protein
MTGDLKDFYLGTPMEYYEYVRIPCTVVPDSIMLEYKLAPLIHNGYVYAEVRQACMVFHKPAELPMSNSQSSWPLMDMHQFLSHLDFGDTQHMTLPSHLWLMTSVSNIPSMLMQNT